MRRAPGTPWRDRVELVGLGFEWPNAALIHGLDTTLGYNPLRIGLVSRTLGARDYIAGPDQRTFSPLFSVLSLRARQSSRPALHRQQHPDRAGRSASSARGELKFLARTRDAYIYENARRCRA